MLTDEDGGTSEGIFYITVFDPRTGDGCGSDGGSDDGGLLGDMHLWGRTASSCACNGGGSSSTMLGLGWVLLPRRPPRMATPAPT